MLFNISSVFMFHGIGLLIFALHNTSCSVSGFETNAIRKGLRELQVHQSHPPFLHQ